MYKELLIILTFKHVTVFVSSKLTGHVLGGQGASIKQYPHAVSLDINSKYSFLCGGSILTQDLVLSAAHCFDDYLGRMKDSVIIKYGASNLTQTLQVRMKYYRVHDHYDDFTLFADLCLLRCVKSIRLGNTVKRVAILKMPPRENVAHVAGWGSVDKKLSIMPNGIKEITQHVRDDSTCKKYLNFPRGTFCAGLIDGKEHPAGGDSGSALMIHQYIQIGIVSFKEDRQSLVVYTNVSYHYNWIRDNAASTFCAMP